MSELTLYIDSQLTKIDQVFDALPRAVLLSLFTWRRANADDALPADKRYGWWGDSFADVANDRIGSRLWLLTREKLTNATALRARQYAEEALAWLVDDGAAKRVDVVAERHGIDRLSLSVTVTRGDAAALNIRFENIWDYLHAV